MMNASTDRPKRNRLPQRWTAFVGAVVVSAAFVVVSAVPADAASTGKGLTRLSQLRNAPIPASCEHGATRLHGYRKDFGVYRGSASLNTRKVVFATLTRSTRKYAIVPLDCDAGGVGWPEVLLVYSSGPRLVGSVDLGRIKTAQEHEQVSRLYVSKHRVHVAWTGYEGAGFAVSTYTGTMVLSKRKVRFHHTAPLTIDFAADDGQSGGFGPGIFSGPSDGGLLDPAPKAFTAFVAHRYSVLAAQHGAYGTDVTVVRLSHRGFAFATESMGWESVVLYSRVKGKWALLGNWGDGPECTSLSKMQRRGLNATHGFCFSSGGGVTYLGSWPRSGQ